MKKNYKNKLFSILGDSVSTLDGYSYPTDSAFYSGMNKFRSDVFAPEDTWWGKVISDLGGRLLINNSFSGSTVTVRPGCVFPSYACSDERTSGLGDFQRKPDVIMVFMGVNDWGHGARVAQNEDESEEDFSVFTTAYRSMLTKLKKNYPDAEIWCLTLPTGKIDSNEGFAFPYTFRGHHIEEYCNVIRACAEEQACRLADVYRNGEPYETFDGFHPSVIGMEQIAKTLIEGIKGW